MATHFTSLSVRDKTYHLSYAGEDVYYSSSNKTGGFKLKGVKFKNNQVMNSSGKALNDYELAQIIASL